jgi:hypothetical protein
VSTRTLHRRGPRGLRGRLSGRGLRPILRSPRCATCTSSSATTPRRTARSSRTTARCATRPGGHRRALPGRRQRAVRQLHRRPRRAASTRGRRHARPRDRQPRLRDDDPRGGLGLRRPPDGLDGPMVRRGQERYGIYCTPCHGGVGDGRGLVFLRSAAGPTVRATQYPQPANLHDDRIRHIPDGQLYATIANGVRNMPGYSAQIPGERPLGDRRVCARAPAQLRSTMEPRRERRQHEHRHRVPHQGNLWANAWKIARGRGTPRHRRRGRGLRAGRAAAAAFSYLFAFAVFLTMALGSTLLRAHSAPHQRLVECHRPTHGRVL